MKNLLSSVLLGVVFTILLATPVFATVIGCNVNIYVDAAPNKYGSPDYAAWEASSFAAVSAGSFVNMANGINPNNVGTTNFEIQDEVVYSFGDLGKRLTWIYWIPNETVANLAGRFQVSLFNYWGNDPALDFYNDYYGSTWLEPTSWIDYNGGVIGTAGMAWWGAYNTNTAAELAADLADWGSVPESWVFTAKLDGRACSITDNRDAVAPVPEPSTMLLMGVGLAGLAFYRKKRQA